MNALDTLQAIRARPVLAVVLFAIAFAALLGIEQLVRPSAQLPPALMPSAGLLAGALITARPYRWPVLIAVALALRGAFIAAPGAPPPGIGLLQAAGVIVSALLVSAAPWLSRPRQAAEQAPNEFATTGIFIGLAASAIYGGAYFVVAQPSSSEAAVIASLSMMLGLLSVGPAVVVMGRHTHMPRPATWRRYLAIAVTTTAFVATALVALAHEPAGIREWLGAYDAAWLWLALVFGVLMALRTHVIGANLAGALVVIVSAVVFFGDIAAPRAGIGNAVLNWQLATLGLLVVLTIAAALIGGKRRANDQRRIQQEISHIMLGRTERAVGDASDAGDEFSRALGLVAALGDAERAGLYWIDDAHIGIAHAWPESADDGDAPLPANVGLDPIRATLGPLLRGRRQHLVREQGEDEAADRAFRQLRLGGDGTIYLQPIVFGPRVIGAIALMRGDDMAFRSVDVAGPLTTIAEFYVSDRTRERALASVRNYQQRLRELAARTVQAEERVRRETAVELHDGLIQRLAVARMKLGEMRHRLGGEGPVGAITEIVDESLVASRAIIHALSPSVLYELGLIPGLERLAEERRERDGFDVTLREHGSGRAVDEAVRVGVYHVVEELVSNSIAHSGGDRVWIDVYWEQSALDAVVVSDNGRGEAWWLAETQPDEPAGLGLLSASERLRPLGYDIKFERRDGGGTRAIVFWTAATAA